MATIGQALTSPESGWQRIDDTNSKIKYGANWTPQSGATGAFNSTLMNTTTLNASMDFKFIGSKLRILAYLDSGRSNNIEISIDNQLYNASAQFAGTTMQGLIFEIQNLTYGNHTVKITNKTSSYFSFDAIDIDDTGYLTHPILTQKTNIVDVNNIGEVIPCKYTASTSGKVGLFAELGTTTSNLIPVTSSATPNGSFYWIYVGKDYLGRKKFIADRNIQHTISWDTLNTAGIASGSGLPLVYNDYLLPSMSSNSQNGITLSDSLGSNTVYNLTQNTFYALESVSGYILVDFGKVVEADKLLIKSVYASGETPTSISIETSFDNIHWNTIVNPTNGKVLINGSTYNFTKVESFRYIKVNILSIDSGVRISLNSLQILKTLFSDFTFTLRLPTGGTSSTDKDNEWDKYVVESTLGGLITAGDNNIWNWQNVFSWISTTISGASANRVVRGSSVSNYSTNNVTSISGTGYGFRPMLIVEIPPPPKTPTNFRYITSGYNITYNWDMVTGASGYRLYSDTTLIADVATNIYTEVNASETNKQVYVVAYNGSGESLPSNTITVKTIPSKPTNLVLTQLQNGFKLDWIDNSNQEVGFKIQRRQSGGNWEQIANITETTYSDIMSIETNILYEYQICAYNEIGDSAFTTWGIETVDSVVLSAEYQIENNKIIYTWDESIGVTGYRLHLTDINNVTTTIDTTDRVYNLNITQDTLEKAYVVAYIQNAYGEFVSSNSNEIETVSIPFNTVTNVRHTYERIDNDVSINIAFNDNSLVEDGFKIKYNLDNGLDMFVDVLSTSENIVDGQYSTTIHLNGSDSFTKITYQIAQYNNSGISQYSSPKTIYKASNVFQGAYREDLGGVYFGWYGIADATEYELVYKINEGTRQSVVVNSNEDVSGVFRKLVTLDSLSTIEATLYPRINSVRQIASQTIILSKSIYTKPQIPLNFVVGWYDEGIAQYTWQNASYGDMGYIFSYNVNNGEQKEIDIPSSNMLDTTKYYATQVNITNHLDTAYGKVKAYTLVDESDYTNVVEIMYVYVIATPPPSFRKEYDTNFNLLLKWDSLEYIDHYELHYLLDSTEFIVNTVDNQYQVSFDYTLVKEFKAFIVAHFTGGKVSDPTDTIIFAPTVQVINAQTTVTNFVSKEGVINEKYINPKLTSKYSIFTNTFTRDVINFVGKVSSYFVLYGTSTFGKILTNTIYKLIDSALTEAIVYNKTIKDFNINSAFVTNDTIKEDKVETSTITKNILSANHKVSSIIKNENVIKSFMNTQWVINKDLINNMYGLFTTYYSIVKTDIEPIHYIINGLSKINVPVETEIHKIRVCTIGDSITAGHPNYWAESGTGNPQSQYQYWLAKRLGSDFEILNNGYGSDTTQRMLDRFNKDVLSKNPQYCIIQGGTNDIYWAMAEKKDDQVYLDAKMEQAKLNIIEMVDRCLENDIIPIVGTLIPRTTAQGIYRVALWKYNDWIINYCNGREGVYYADFYNAGKTSIPPTPLEDTITAGALNPLYDGDSTFDQYGNLMRRGYGVHPNVLGYKIMAECISLNIFKSLTADLKIYLDAECTVEETQVIGNSYIQTFVLDLKNMDRGRIKTTTRYMKNIGNKPVLYSLYATKEENMDIKFSVNKGEYKDFVTGRLDPQSIHTVELRLDIPKFGDTPAIKLNLPIRSIKTLGQ